MIASRIIKTGYGTLKAPPSPWPHEPGRTQVPCLPAATFISGAFVEGTSDASQPPAEATEDP
jgi:hypothetical protein